MSKRHLRLKGNRATGKGVVCAFIKKAHPHFLPFTLYLLPSQANVSKFIAILVTSSLVLTMPGTTAWATSSTKNSNNGVQIVTPSSSSKSPLPSAGTAQNFASLPPGYVVQPDGQSPSKSYKPLIGRNGASQQTLATAGDTYQTIEGLMNVAADLMNVTPKRLMSGGLPGLQNISAKVAHNVYSPSVNAPDVIEPGSIAQSAVHAARMALIGDPNGDSVDVSQLPTSPSGASLQDGTMKLNQPAPQLDASLASLDALERGKKNDPKQPSIQGEWQQFIDQYKQLYINAKVDWLNLNDKLVENNDQIKLYVGQIKKSEADLKRLQEEVSQLMNQMGDAAAEGTSALIASDERQIASLQNIINKDNKLLGSPDLTNKDTKTLYGTRNDLQGRMDDLHKNQLVPALNQLNQFSKDNMPGHYDFWHPLQDGQTNKYDTSKTLDQAAQDLHDRSKPKVSMQGLISGHKNTLIYGGAAAVISGAVLLTIAIVGWPITLGVVVGGIVLTSAAATFGAFRDTQRSGANLSKQDDQQYVKTATDPRVKLMENYILGNKQFDRQFLLNSLKDGTTANFMKALHAADNLNSAASQKIKTLINLLNSIEMGDTGARAKLLAAAAAWEGQPFLNKWGNLNSKDLAGVMGQTESNNARNYLNGVINPNSAKTFWGQLRNSSVPGSDAINQIAKQYGLSDSDLVLQAKDANGQLMTYTNGSKVLDPSSVTRIIQQLASKGNADALAIARADGVPIFDSNTGAVISAAKLDSLLVNTTPEGQAALSTFTYDNYVRGWHTSSDAAIARMPWNSIPTGWNQGMKEYAGTDPITQTGEALWGAFQGGVGSAFDTVLAPVSLMSGETLRGVGSLMPDDSYIGTVFKETGAAQVGNNLYTQGLFGDTAVSEINKTFGWSSTPTSPDDSRLMPKFDGTHNGTFSTGNSSLDRALNWQRQNFMSSSGQYLSTGGDVLGSLNIKSGMGALASEGWNLSLHGQEGGAGLIATGLGVSAAETAVQIASFGGINSIIESGTEALGKLGVAGADTIGSAAQLGLVRLPAMQFNISVANGLGHAMDGLSAYQSGDLTAAANNFGDASTTVIGTILGAGLTAGVQQGWKAASDLNLNTESLGRPVSFLGDRVPAFLGQSLVGGTFEAGKMLAQGGLTLIGGDIVPGLGSIAGAVGGSYGTEAIAKNYATNTQAEITAQVAEGREISVAPPSLLERIAGAQAMSKTDIGSIADKANNAMQVVAQAQAAEVDTSISPPAPQAIADAAKYLAPSLHMASDGSVSIGDQKLDLSNPVVKAASNIKNGVSADPVFSGNKADNLVKANESAEADRLSPTERASQMLKLTAEAEPAHKLVVYEQVLKEGKLLEERNPAEFQKWLERNNVALTKNGFDNVWNSYFGDKTFDQAQAEMNAESGGSSADYLKQMQGKLSNVLNEHGVNFSEISNPHEAAKIDSARSELMRDSSVKDRAVLARLFAEAALKGTSGLDMRAAQTAMVSLFGSGKNAGVEAGGGKTAAFVIDQGVHSMLDRNLYRGEILAESAAGSNKYVTDPIVAKLSRAFGLKVVDAVALQTNGDVKGLVSALKDPQSLVIMDPVTRGHLSNQAVSNTELRSALQESNVVGYDEVHQAATNRTSSIIGGADLPPSADLVNKTKGLANEVVARTNGADGALNKNVVFETNNLSDFRNQLAMLNASETAGVVRFGDHMAISDEFNAQLSAQGFKSGEIGSVVRNLVMDRGERNSYEIGQDENGRTIIFPVNESGRIEKDQISNDTIGQITVALKEGLDPMTSVRVQRTEMQTGLASIFENPNARQVGASATIEGLNRLLKSRIGSESIGVSTSRLELGELLNANDKALKQGGITTLRINGEEIIPDLNNEAHRWALVDGMRESLKQSNVVIASESPELQDFFKEAFKANIVGDRGAELVINGHTVDSVINEIAKEQGPGKVIIMNPRAYQGTDVQMKAALWVMEAEKLPEQELIQLLKRVNRPDPMNSGMRWEASRHLVLSNAEALESSLRLVNEIDRMAKAGEVDLTHVFGDKAKTLLERYVSGEPLSLQEKLELNAFAKQAALNSEAAKFAIQDALRDDQIIQPLKQALTTRFTPDSFGYRVIKEALDKVMNSYGEYAPLTAKDYSADLTRTKFMAQTLDHVAKEAKSVLDFINQKAGILNTGSWLKSTGDLKNWVRDQRSELKAFNSAVNHYEEIQPRADRSIATAATPEEFLGVLKRTSELILTGETVVTSQNIKAINAADQAWNAVRDAVRGAQTHINDIPFAPSLTAARSVYASLAQVDLSSMGTDYRKALFANLMTAQNPQELQKMLGQFARKVYLTKNPALYTTGSAWKNASTQLVSLPGQGVQYVQGVINSMNPVGNATPQLVQSLISVVGDNAPSMSRLHLAALNRLQLLASNTKTNSTIASALTSQRLQQFNAEAQAKLSSVLLTALSIPGVVDKQLKALNLSKALQIEQRITTANKNLTTALQSQNKDDIAAAHATLQDLHQQLSLETAKLRTAAGIVDQAVQRGLVDGIGAHTAVANLIHELAGDSKTASAALSSFLKDAKAVASLPSVLNSPSMLQTLKARFSNHQATNAPVSSTPSPKVKTAMSLRPGVLTPAHAATFFIAGSALMVMGAMALSIPVLSFPVLGSIAALGGMFYYFSRPTVASYSSIHTASAGGALTPVPSAKSSRLASPDQGPTGYATVTNGLMGWTQLAKIAGFVLAGPVAASAATAVVGSESISIGAVLAAVGLVVGIYRLTHRPQKSQTVPKPVLDAVRSNA